MRRSCRTLGLWKVSSSSCTLMCLAICIYINISCFEFVDLTLMKGTSPCDKDNSLLVWKSSRPIEGVDLGCVDRHVRLVNIDIVILRHFFFNIFNSICVIGHRSFSGCWEFWYFATWQTFPMIPNIFFWDERHLTWQCNICSKTIQFISNFALTEDSLKWMCKNSRT